MATFETRRLLGHGSGHDGRNGILGAACPYPNYGILSRRIFHSPMVKYILSARICSTLSHHVVFVGARFVQVREVEQGDSISRTRFVAVKDDFASEILNARVISLANGLPAARHADAAFAIKREHELDDRGASGHVGPPQMLLLTLASHQLVLLGMTQAPGGAWTFVTSALALPAMGDEISNPGDFIAVDPHSRAIAVASFGNLLTVFATRSTTSPHPDLSSLVSQSRSVSLGCTVQQVEFLLPRDESAGTVQLLLITVREGAVECVFYCWDAELPLAQALNNRKVTKLSVGFPNLLIPSVRFPGNFMLASEQSLYLYSADENGHIVRQDAERTGTHQNVDPRPVDPGTSLRRPNWVNWGLPTSDKDLELLYLARADGWVCYRMIRRHPKTQKLIIESGGSGDNLATAIGSAFCLTDEQSRYNEYRSYNQIFLSGDCSDGGFWTAGNGDAGNKIGSPTDRVSVMRPVLQETFYNWAPFLDALVLKARHQTQPRGAALPADSRQSASPSDRSSAQDTLIATTGKNASGAISELRFGCEIALRNEVSLKDFFGDEVATSIIPISADHEGQYTIALSSPLQTKIVLLDLAKGEIRSRVLCKESILDAAILLHGAGGSAPVPELPHRPALFISETHAYVVNLGDIDFGYETQIDSLPTPIPRTSLVAVEARSSMLVTARRNETVTQLRLEKVMVDQTRPRFAPVGGPIQLRAEPSCISLFAAPEAYSKNPPQSALIAVGDTVGAVHLFHADFSHGLRHIVSRDLGELLGLVSLESVCWLPGNADPSDTLYGHLLCGTRSGHLVALQFDAEHEIAVSAAHVYQISEGPLNISQDLASRSSAFVISESRFCYVHFLDRTASSGQISEAYWINRDDREWASGPVYAMCQTPLASKTPGEVIAVTATDLIAGSFNDHPHPLPRRFDIRATPSRVLYSEALHTLFVASVKGEVVENTRYSVSKLESWSLPRDMHPIFGLSSGHERARRAEHVCEVGERICAVAEWVIPRDGKSHVMIAVGTSVQKTGKGFLRLFRLSSDKRSLESKYCGSEDQGVWAIAGYDARSLVYCSGEDLVFRVRDDRDRLKRQSQVSLPSHGMFLTAHASGIIKVTTEFHSVMTYIVRPNGLQKLSSDRRGRLGIAHLSLSEPHLTLIADQNRCVTGIVEHSMPALQREAPFTFEASLPSSVTRLVRANIRPPWKRRRTQGIVERDIVGTCADGSLFGFTILTEAAWRFLSFVQAMCERSHELCTMQRRFTRAPKHLEPQPSSPKDWHVDGDILARLAGREDATRLLDVMLDAKPVKNEELNDFENADTRRHRFIQLLQEVLAISADDGGCVGNAVERLDLAGEHQDAASSAIQYIRNVTETPF